MISIPGGLFDKLCLKIMLINIIYFGTKLKCYLFISYLSF
nr:MAG TPA: hypothetical protein [Caudoviricetes sp.]